MVKEILLTTRVNHPHPPLLAQSVNFRTVSVPAGTGIGYLVNLPAIPADPYNAYVPARQAVICTDNFRWRGFGSLSDPYNPPYEAQLWYASYTQGATVNCPSGMRKISEKIIASINSQSYECTEFSYGYIYSTTQRDAYSLGGYELYEYTGDSLPLYGRRNANYGPLPAGSGFSAIGRQAIRPYNPYYQGGSTSFQKEALCYSPAP